MPPNVLRNLPSVSELLESPPLKKLVDKMSRSTLLTRVRSVLDDLRSEVQSATSEIGLPAMTELAERIARRILESERPALRPLVNASGSVLRDDLGRAPLAEEALGELLATARGYSNLELDLVSGEPAPRAVAVTESLRELTGAEAALVVNNGAGAVMLTLAALASGREVVVSRGQLVELSRGCRLLDMIAASGALVCEVGTTNATYVDDYARAITDLTAGLWRVQATSFVVSGSTSEVTLRELVELGRKRQLPVVDDLGWAALVDLEPLGCGNWPQAATSLREGADLVLACGDKLVGGPQCGIILGRRSYVETLARHPLARALQLDKLALSALAGTLRLYRNPGEAQRSIPIWQLLTAPLENLKLRAERLAPQMAECTALRGAEPVPTTSDPAGSALPARQMASWAIALEPAQMSAERLAARLRTGEPAVLGRVSNERVYLDLRSVFPREDQQLVSAVLRLGEKSD
jgi:L-seryl-tRNA(Ser) seleniumtransferase